MVRSESADEEVVIDKYDELEDCGEDDFSPAPRWATQHHHANAGVRPHSRATSSLSPTASDPDRRLRRQIANCNERRRMQSINAGFQSLRALLPRKEGEKLSKAAILQQTADLIHTLKTERARLVEIEGPGGKKAKMDDYGDIEQRAMIDRLQMALERERTSRLYLEQQINQLREQLFYQAGLSPASPSLQPMAPPPQEASVIRPTPLPPLSVDVSPPRVSTTAVAPPATTTTTPQHQAPPPPPSLLTSSTPSAFSTSTTTAAAHRSLQTILDAIRHLEGGAVLAAHSPPPTSQATVVR